MLLSCSGCSLSDSVIVLLQKCVANLILNCKSLIEFLISNGKEFHNVCVRKKERFVMLVVEGAVFYTNNLILYKQSYIIQTILYYTNKRCLGEFGKDDYLHCRL